MSQCCLSPNAAKKAVQSFWLLGLLNNTPWVLMLAVATNISAGGVALVFLANQVPGLIVKISAPYWFHLISYKSRIHMVSAAMGTACFLVGCGGLFRDDLEGDDKAEPRNNDGSGRQWGLALELFGVSFVSFSCNLGEASLLALAGKFDSVILSGLLDNGTRDTSRNISQQDSHYVNDNADSLFTEENDLNDNSNEIDSGETDAGTLMKEGGVQQRRSITAFSSGTGLAGIVGYGYKALFSDLFGWGLSSTIWSAGIFSFVYFFIYLRGLHDLEQSVQQDKGNSDEMTSRVSESSQLVSRGDEDSTSALEMAHTGTIHDSTISELESPPPSDTNSVAHLTALERFWLVLSLWPYIIPLFTVYAAEYMLQAGVWSAIGFPVTSASARAQFYHYSNWTYQVGVFLSRSSGNLCTISLKILWLMPMLQIVNLFFFWMNSIHHFWDNFGLLLPCLFAGFLGGSVYVQGYSRVNADLPVELREFAIASVGVADSLGIMVADVLSLFIQSCIYKQNHLEGAIVKCPY